MRATFRVFAWPAFLALALLASAVTVLFGDPARGRWAWPVFSGAVAGFFAWFAGLASGGWRRRRRR